MHAIERKQHRSLIMQKCFSQNLIKHDKTIYSKANGDEFHEV